MVKSVFLFYLDTFRQSTHLFDPVRHRMLEEIAKGKKIINFTLLPFNEAP